MAPSLDLFARSLSPAQMSSLQTALADREMDAMNLLVEASDPPALYRAQGAARALQSLVADVIDGRESRIPRE